MSHAGRKGQRGEDVLTLKILIIGENFIDGHARGKPLKNVLNRITKAAYARLDVTNGWVDGYTSVHRNVP